jgi:hypothetical protein
MTNLLTFFVLGALARAEPYGIRLGGRHCGA